MKTRHNYKNLKIWKLGLEIANNTSDVLLTFPKHERYDLSSQISRCSISMPSNIALGSSFELGTQLLIAQHRQYIDQETLKQLEQKIEEFQRMTMSFQNNLNL